MCRKQNGLYGKPQVCCCKNWLCIATRSICKFIFITQMYSSIRKHTMMKNVTIALICLCVFFPQPSHQTSYSYGLTMNKTIAEQWVYNTPKNSGTLDCYMVSASQKISLKTGDTITVQGFCPDPRLIGYRFVIMTGGGCSSSLLGQGVSVANFYPSSGNSYTCTWVNLNPFGGSGSTLTGNFTVYGNCCDTF